MNFIYIPLFHFHLSYISRYTSTCREILNIPVNFLHRPKNSVLLQLYHYFLPTNLSSSYFSFISNLSFIFLKTFIFHAWICLHPLQPCHLCPHNIEEIFLCLNSSIFGGKSKIFAQLHNWQFMLN